MCTDNADPDQTASWGIYTVDIVCKNTYANGGLNNIYFYSQLIYMQGSDYKYLSLIRSSLGKVAIPAIFDLLTSPF